MDVSPHGLAAQPIIFLIFIMTTTFPFAFPWPHGNTFKPSLEMNHAQEIDARNLESIVGGDNPGMGPYGPPYGPNWECDIYGPSWYCNEK